MNDRTPVILPAERIGAWLDPELIEPIGQHGDQPLQTGPRLTINPGPAPGLLEAGPEAVRPLQRSTAS